MSTFSQTTFQLLSARGTHFEVHRKDQPGELVYGHKKTQVPVAKEQNRRAGNLPCPEQRDFLIQGDEIFVPIEGCVACGGQGQGSFIQVQHRALPANAALTRASISLCG